MGALSLGYGPDGQPLRKTVSPKTRGEVARKMKEPQRHVDDGIPLPDTTLTVAQLFKGWYEDVLCHQVAVSASSNYKRIFDHHFIPTLGRLRVTNLSVADVDRLISQKISTGLSVSPSKPRLLQPSPPGGSARSSTGSSPSLTPQRRPSSCAPAR